MRLFATLAVAALLFAAALPGNAEEAPVRATGVQALVILHLALGSSAATDDCLLADMDGSGTVTNFDLLLVACHAKVAGATVGDADTVLKMAFPTLPAVRVVFADTDGDGAHNASTDGVYLTSAATGFGPTTSSSAFTARLTPGPPYAAGTWVASSDSDLLSYAASAQPLPAEVVSMDLDGDGWFDMGDRAYLALTNGTVAGAAIPLGSIRLTGSSLGGFGSRVLSAVTILPTSGPTQAIRVVQVGGCLYGVASGTVAVAGSLRVTPCAGHAAGTFVLASHPDVGVNGTLANATVHHADSDNNGRFGVGDSVWLALPDFAPTNATNSLVRLTGPTAGSLVIAGDADFAFAGHTQSAAASVARVLDRLYLLFEPAGHPAGELPLHAVRLTASNPHGPYGSQVGLSGDGPIVHVHFATAAPTTTPTSSSTTATVAPSATPRRNYAGETPPESFTTSATSTPTASAAPAAGSTASSSTSPTTHTTPSPSWTPGQITVTGPFPPRPMTTTSDLSTDRARDPVPSLGQATTAATEDAREDGTEEAPGAALAGLVALLAVAAAARRRLA